MATVKNSTTKVPAVSAESFESMLTLTFQDGRVIELDAAGLNDEIRHQALMHGLKQKLLDAAAIARNTITGASASLDDKFDAVKEVYDRITGEAPTWNKPRGEGGGAIGGLLKRALMQLTGKTAAEVEEFLEGKSKEEKAALRKNPKVAAIILELQTAGADDEIDTDALLDELND